MIKSNFQLLLQSFLGRLIPEDTAYSVPGGRISKQEVDAIRFFSEQSAGADGVGPDAKDDVSVKPTTSGKSDESSWLNLISFDREGPSETDLRLCLDFGTAMSKAWGAGGAADDTLPLVLGRADGEQEKTLAVPSSIFISKSGRIYLGDAAERQHRQEIESGRRRFDDIKRILSDAEVDQDLDEVPASVAIDPTESGLTKGGLLTLYLAWLTDLALCSLADLGAREGITSDQDMDSFRATKRRFALPCFESAIGEGISGGRRANWAKGVLERSILRAQIVADSLHGSWGDLDVKTAKRVLDDVRSVDVDELSALFTDQRSIREPVAAGSSRFNEAIANTTGNVRKYLLVVDAGAGTTDFALFQVFYNSDTKPIRYGLITPSVRMIRIAGNAVDAVLRPLILRACKIDSQTGNPLHDSDFSLLKVDLDSRIRTLKLLLFEKGEVEINLVPSAKGRLALSDVLEDPSFRDLGKRLMGARRSILESVFHDEYIEKMSLRGEVVIPIQVLLTGGSSSLPIMLDLSTGEIDIRGAKFGFHKIHELPGWVESLPADVADLVAVNYRQCAVAIGGSVLELPSEINDLELAITPPRTAARHLTLERYPVTGN